MDCLNNAKGACSHGRHCHTIIGGGVYRGVKTAICGVRFDDFGRSEADARKGGGGQPNANTCGQGV